MWFRVWSYRFWECAISFYSVCCFHQEHHLSKCMRKAFSKLKFSSAKSQIFTATSSPSWAHLPSWHIFPFMGTSSFMAHLPLHGHIFPFMGASTSSWPPLPLHGCIYLFMGTSSPSWVHLPLHGHLFPFMGASSPSWAHLPLHGCIYLFMATSSPSWAHLPLRGHIHHGKAFCAEMVIVRLSFWLSFKTGNISGKMNFMTSPPARSTGHLITFSCLAFGTESI